MLYLWHPVRSVDSYDKFHLRRWINRKWRRFLLIDTLRLTWHHLKFWILGFSDGMYILRSYIFYAAKQNKLISSEQRIGSECDMCSESTSHTNAWICSCHTQMEICSARHIIFGTGMTVANDKIKFSEKWNDKMENVKMNFPAEI